MELTRVPLLHPRLMMQKTVTAVMVSTMVVNRVMMIALQWLRVLLLGSHRPQPHPLLTPSLRGLHGYRGHSSQPNGVTMVHHTFAHVICHAAVAASTSCGVSTPSALEFVRK